MSLYGSLFAGVSGLAAQSTAMGIISDNIANVNTIGYKATSARFQTQITESGAESTYSPGGVRAKPFALVAQQGLVQASSSALDIAMTGNGFFVVNSLADQSGSTNYTRAGSFNQDNLGNLINTAGFYLQGWPLDPNELLPGAAGNTTNTTSSADLNSLDTVNVNQVNGVAAATTTVEVGANLTASETAFAGPSDTTISLSITSAADLSGSGHVDGDQIRIVHGSINQVFEYDPTPVAASGEYSTLAELTALIDAVNGLTAAVGGSASDATITVTGDDPRDSLVISNVVNTPATELFGGAPPLTTVDTYDETDSTKNMASGTVSADFSRSARVFDAQGTGHDVQLAFLKVAANTWAVEVYASPATDVTISSPLVNGQLAVGTVTFNGDATLNSVSSGLSSAVSVAWTSGASASSITFDWGTAGVLNSGLSDGLSQFDGSYNVAFVNQNGSEVGQLNGVTIDENGFVIASFSNGATKRLYKLPVATFADVSSLKGENGNVYSQSDKSGEFNLREAGKGGAGLLAPSALEAANVDLGKEFTDMIVTQRAFTASSRIITTVDELLEDLIRI